MFKQGSFETELFETMKSNLLIKQADNKFKITKLAKATDALNKAASLFDKIGLTEESEELVNILTKLTNDLK